MTLTELLNSISSTKASLKTKLGTSSDALDEYPTLIENYLITYYNNGYKAGYKSATGNTPANPKSLKEYTATTPSWQGQDTNELSTLVNIMSGIADIRVKMRQALGISSNTFSTYPSALDTQASAQYNAGYTAGEQDGTSSTPTKVSTPVFTIIDTNKINISSSDATSIRYWVSNSLGGTAISGTTVTVTSSSTVYNVTSTYNGKYLCAIGMASGKTNSDVKSGQMTYVEPSTPVVEVPNAPTWYRISNSNLISISSESGTYIKYTTNGGVSWTTISSNSGTIPITSRVASGNLKAYCYYTSTNESSPTITWSGDFELYVAPSDDMKAPSGTPSSDPFWIYCNNRESSTSYKIRTSGTDKLQISTTRNFSSLLTPTVDSGNDVFTLSGKTYYFIRSYSETTIAPMMYIPSSGYSGGMMLNIGGNLRSLVSGTISSQVVAASAFASYFKKNTSDDNQFYQAIQDASQLFFPDGAQSSYEYMFDSCSYLKSIPATISAAIGRYTFRYCFQNCTRLETGCNLTASSVGYMGCYRMFNGCTTMTAMGNISATSCDQGSFNDMFYNCTSLVTGPASLNMTTIGNSCCKYMFDGCTKLKKAPVLNMPSIEATQSMYMMFRNCSSLEEIEIHFVKWDTSWTTDWVKGVSSSGRIIKGSECQWYLAPSSETNTGYAVHTGTNGIPSGWVIEDEE